MTPTAVGWVLAEGQAADGTILDHRELPLHAGRGVRAASTAEQVADEVMRVDALAAASDHHLRLIGMTWNDEASAQAALLLEALTDAGFHNVVPVRLLEAVETLARAIAPVLGYEQIAVCVVEHDATTVVMVDTHDGDTQTAIKQVHGGLDGLTRWLSGMFERNGWQPGGVVVVADSDINALSCHLETTLPVPVFAQTTAQVTIARGAALSAARSTDFTDEQLVAHNTEPVATPPRPRRLPYAGAMTALAAGAITFVCSLSLAVGIQLAPDNEPATPKHVLHAPTPQIAEGAEGVAPVVAPPPVAAPPTPEAQAPAGEPIVEPAGPDSPRSGPAEREPGPDGGQPYLTRVLEHIPGEPSAPADDAAPYAPTQP